MGISEREAAHRAASDAERVAWVDEQDRPLGGVPRAELGEGSQQLLATTLMAYARPNPDRIRGQLMPVIVYDPQAGRRAFTVAMEKLGQ